MIKKLTCSIALACACTFAYAETPPKSANQPTIEEKITRPTGVGYAFNYLKNNAPKHIDSILLHAQNVLGFSNDKSMKCAEKTSRNNPNQIIVGQRNNVNNPQDQASVAQPEQNKTPSSALRTRLTTTVETTRVQTGSQSQAAKTPKYCVIENAMDVHNQLPRR